MNNKAAQSARIGLLGAGDRGSIYARFLSEAGGQIVAVVDQDPVRARHLSDSVPDAIQFSNWKELLKKSEELSLDAVVVALPDREHLGPALEFSRKGISVLLEKPVGLTIAELDKMQRHVNHLRKKKIEAAIVVCHVLRYSQFFGTIRRLIQEGTIGEVRSILHAENVSYFHFAHSYVRGNWAHSKKSSPVLLAKCSHDFDLIGWYASSEFTSVHCSGELRTFLPENAPAGATHRCLDGCPHDSCLYHARTTYLEGLPLKREMARMRNGLAIVARFSLAWPRLFRRIPFLSRLYPWPYWPTTTIVSGPVTTESVMDALRNGPYGRCVYTAHSDQPDHADTVIAFKNGVTAIMRLNGNSYQEARTVRIEGTAGTLEGRFGQGGDLVLRKHGSHVSKRISVKADQAGHLAEDRALCFHFLEVLDCIGSDRTDAGTRQDCLQQSDSVLHQVIEGHRMALLAERSRTSGRTIFR